MGEPLYVSYSMAGRAVGRPDATGGAWIGRQVLEADRAVGGSRSVCRGGGRGCLESGGGVVGEEERGFGRESFGPLDGRGAELGFGQALALYFTGSGGRVGVLDVPP